MMQADMPVEEVQESYSTEQAAEHAKQWCAKHPGWQRICDIPSVDALYMTFSELPKRVQNSWEKRGGESAWLEFGEKPCKVARAFISGKGEFYTSILEVPRFHNLMTIFQIR